MITGDRETIPLYGTACSPKTSCGACTTCRACMTECPAMIEHVDDIVGSRRKLTMIQSEVPASV